jgi:hypothetical protein
MAALPGSLCSPGRGGPLTRLRSSSVPRSIAGASYFFDLAELVQGERVIDQAASQFSRSSLAKRPRSAPRE